MNALLSPGIRLLTFLVLAATALDAPAQGYPFRQITFIMPIAVGSAIESHLRLLAGEAAKELGQPLVVENRVGAGGKLGMQALMASRSDGYTIGMAFNGITTTQALVDPAFAIRPGKDYVPVILTSSSPLIITAPATAPFKDLNGLIAYAKANPGKLSVAGASRGSNAHLGWELLKLMTGTDFTLVIYQGEAAATIDLMNGLVLALLGSATAKGHIESGKLIALATTGATRWSTFPKVPTVDEAAGLKGFSVGGWYGIVAPAGTGPEIVHAVNAAFKSALGNGEVRKKLGDLGISAIGSSPDEYGAHIRQELERWGPVIGKIGLKLD